MNATLHTAILAATKDAMRARDRERVKALRLINAAVKQAEIDSRAELDDDGVLAVLTRMRKQRLDSLQQFTDAGRDDLAAIEQHELDVILEFMPQPLTAEELKAAVDSAVSATAASSMRDMGKVMAALRDELAGRADLGEASQLVRQALSR